MISWSDINLLQKQKLSLQVKLNDLLNTPDISLDKINELKSEILYLDKQISKLLGSNELDRLEKIKDKKSGIQERNVKAYYELKNKYKKISKMSQATKRMLSTIENTLNPNQTSQEIETLTEERIKVKI